jgi:hypothetical protein
MTTRSTPVRLGFLFAAGMTGAAALAAASCTSDTTPIVYIGMAYQVRCLDCQPRVPDESAHDVRAVNGEAGYNMSCVANKEGGTRRVTFSAEHKNDSAARNYTLLVRGARLAAEESDGPCEVRLIEGDNTYVAACSTDEPSTDRPCQVTTELKGDVIKGKIYCDKVPSEASLTSVRYLVAPYTQTDPAEFELYGCAGI